MTDLIHFRLIYSVFIRSCLVWKNKWAAGHIEKVSPPPPPPPRPPPRPPPPPPPAAVPKNVASFEGLFCSGSCHCNLKRRRWRARARAFLLLLRLLRLRLLRLSSNNNNSTNNFKRDFSYTLILQIGQRRNLSRPMFQCRPTGN